MRLPGSLNRSALERENIKLRCVFCASRAGSSLARVIAPRARRSSPSARRRSRRRTAGGGGTGGRRRRRQEREVHRSAYGNLAHPPAGAGAPERAGHRDRQGAARRAIIAPRCSAVALRRSEVAALTDGRFSGGFTLEAKAAARHANAATAVGVGPAISDRVSWRFSRGCRRGGAWWGGAARPSASRSGETRLKADR